MIYSLCAVSISDDASLLAGSFDDSLVRLWGLTNKKLQYMKPPSQLSLIASTAGRVIVTILVICLVLYYRGCYAEDTRQ